MRTLNEIRDALMLRVYGEEDGDFGVMLCTEIHRNGLTFDTLAAKWEISLPLLGMLIADHCYKLTATKGVDDQVHTVEEYHARFDFDDATQIGGERCNSCGSALNVG